MLTKSNNFPFPVMTEFLLIFLSSLAGKISPVLIYGIFRHEHLTAIVAFDCRYSDVAAHVVLHVEQLAGLFLTNVALENLIEAA